MTIADLVLAHGGGCWECGIATSIMLLALFAIPVGIVWLLIRLLVGIVRATRRS
jgi:hypothetical protein